MRCACALFLLGFVSAAGIACGTPAHTVERLRFSDEANAKAESHSDTFDAKFEMGKSPFVHGHLDISYQPGWWTRDITATCDLTGPPESGPTLSIEEHVPLNRGKDRISWPMSFSASGSSGMFKWVEGKYSARCRTSSGSVSASFELVDTAAAMARARSLKPLSEIFGPDYPGRSNAPWSAIRSPEPKIDWDRILADRWFEDTFGHKHDVPAWPPSVFPTPSPRPSATPTPTPAPPAPRVTVTFRNSATPTGEDGTPGDRFDSATLQYVVFEVDIPPEITSYTFSGCGVDRVSTGTRLIATTTQLLDFKTGRMVFRGGVGFGRTSMMLPGEYRLVCDARGVTIPPRTFAVTGEINGYTAEASVLTLRATKIPVANASPKYLRFFEAGPTVPPAGSRRYGNSFEAPVRYISTEVALDLEASKDPMKFSYRCNYFESTGKLLGQTRAMQDIAAGSTSLTMTAGWGNAAGTFWKPGRYYVECDLAEVFLAASFFRIVRR